MAAPRARGPLVAALGDRLTAPRYPIYIPTRGRHEHAQALTIRSLLADRVPFRAVVEPQEAEKYAAVLGEERLLVLPFSDLGQGSIPARNWIKDRATEEGHERHWQLDDNIIEFRRLWKGRRIPCPAGVALRACEDFSDRYENVALSGLNYQMFVPAETKVPFVRNVHVYSCTLVNNAIPNRWRGRYNEDTDLCLQVLADGWCTILLNAFMANKMKTMAMSGGNTDDLYQGDGRLRMARALERRWPGVVSVSRRYGRPQHVVNWRKFDTPLKPKAGFDLAELSANDYGLRLVEQRPVKSTALRAAMLPDSNEIARDERTGLFYRPNTVDLSMIRGDSRGYVRKMPIEPGDRVLDVGAHIGGATRSFLENGAELVVSVEPDPGNFDLLRKNTKGLHRAKVIRAAAVADGSKAVQFFPGSANGTSMGSLTEHRGRATISVPAVDFSDLIERHSINYVKLDCEGAEYDLLSPPLPATVGKLVVEFHANHKRWRERWPAAIAALRDQGFEADRADPGRPTEKAWVWTVAWRRSC